MSAEPRAWGFTMPCAAVRWVLTGEDVATVDVVAASLIGAGVAVEPIKPGSSYRLAGPYELLDVLAAELAPTGMRLEIERPPAEPSVTMATTVAPVAARRSVTVHGLAGAGYVMRAVDRGLHVSPAGASRWAVSGRTGALVAWLAAVWQRTEADAGQRIGIAAETVAREDAAAPAVVVELPTRQTVTEITRDHEGDIRAVVQLERTVREEKKS